MQHVWSVFCRTAVTDKESNSVSLLECVERVSAEYVGPEPPTDIPLLCKFVTLWRRQDSKKPERGKAWIVVEGPNGEPVREWKHEVDLSEHVRARVFLEVTGLPYQGNGVYEFVVSVTDADADTSFEVARVPAEIEINHRTGEEPA